MHYIVYRGVYWVIHGVAGGDHGTAIIQVIRVLVRVNWLIQTRLRELLFHARLRRPLCSTLFGDLALTNVVVIGVDVVVIMIIN